MILLEQTRLTKHVPSEFLDFFSFFFFNLTNTFSLSKLRGFVISSAQSFFSNLYKHIAENCSSHLYGESSKLIHKIKP